MVSAARGYVCALLADTPITYTAALIASELATNAVCHGGSGFTLRVQTDDGWARIDVTDPGTRWTSRLPADDLDDHGRGLAIVAALATRSGHQRGPDGTTAWAELTWT